ncbi:MAG: biotin--[acetyl-CoA-carboxylase] ligase [Lentimicrobium sp.]|nr:biotin--[acetyl-CoA-carboxylase] ligase [Lentimicrobium sp.]
MAKTDVYMTFDNSEFIFLDSTESTNLYALELLKSRRLNDGSVIVAHTQTRGKGQENNQWESTPGKNLTATIVFYPAFLSPERQFQLTKVISLSVCTLIDKLILPKKSLIKWPNDIYVSHHKIAGILINNEITGNRISCSIAGLGLNINQESFSINAPLAISLKMITGKEYILNDILTDWHKNVIYWYEKLLNPVTSQLDDAYLERLYLLNQPAEYEIRGERMTATIRGLAEYGMLLLENKNGKQYKCALKEIVFIRQTV